jgi:hypothetical protein
MLFVRNRDVTFTPVVPPADCNAQVAAAIIEDRKKAKIVYS